MTTHSPDLERFRAELRDAIEKDLARHAARRRTARRTARLAVPAVLAAVLGTSLTLMPGAGPGIRPADAAVLTAVEAALTPPAGTILHERAMVTVGNEPPERYEAWIEASAPGATRVIKEGWEGAWDGKTFSTYDQASNTITVGGYIPGHAVDIAATLRSLIASGQARVTGTTVVDGVPARTLAISGLPGGRVGGAVNGTYDVTLSDDYPLLVQTTLDCGSGPCTETLRFQTYEYLPATPANLALLNLETQHPTATIRAAANQGS